MKRACALLAAVLWLAPASSAGAQAAGQRHALIVTGASGGPPFTENHERWRGELVSAFHERLGFGDDRVIVLAEKPGDDERVANRENVRDAVATLRSRLGPDDLLLIVLIGHGTYDGVDAKFNLVGPDLDSREWSELLDGLPGRLVFINGASASFPFLRDLAGPDRIVITATDSPAQRFATVFPEFLAEAIADPSSDLDKNGRISVWEAFVAVSTRVRQWYEQRGQLPTERPNLDDSGEGVGREAGDPGPSSALALRTYLTAEPLPPPTDDEELAALLRRRAEIEAALEQLKIRRDMMPSDDYAAELERLLIELARVSSEIRSRSPID